MNQLQLGAKYSKYPNITDFEPKKELRTLKGIKNIMT
jgi:hypothetical protein